MCEIICINVNDFKHFPQNYIGTILLSDKKGKVFKIVKDNEHQKYFHQNKIWSYISKCNHFASKYKVHNTLNFSTNLYLHFNKTYYIK